MHLTAGLWLAVSAIVADPEAVIATVNGQSITVRDVDFLALSRGVTNAQLPDQREPLIELLIERQLIRSFLSDKKVSPDPDRLDLQIHHLEELARRRQEDPATLFPKLGLTPERLKSELGLPLAWAAYIEKSVTTAERAQYFAEHRSELDGTRVRVRRIFRKATDDAARAAAERLLMSVKADLLAKKLSFEEAVRKHSEAPSKDQGGDVGWIGGRGRLPDELTLPALKLNVGDMAGPLRSAFGVDLIQVTEREPGQLSLEDARPLILEHFANVRWKTTVAEQRAVAKITRTP